VGHLPATAPCFAVHSQGSRHYVKQVWCSQHDALLLPSFCGHVCVTATLPASSSSTCRHVCIALYPSCILTHLLTSSPFCACAACCRNAAQHAEAASRPPGARRSPQHTQQASGAQEAACSWQALRLVACGLCDASELQQPEVVVCGQPSTDLVARQQWEPYMLGQHYVASISCQCNRLSLFFCIVWLYDICPC
jgi:hypothetical protein